MALDLSKRSAGLTGWDGTSTRPVVLSKELGSTITNHGLVFARLHGVMNDLWQVIGGADAIYCEEPLQPQALGGHTTFDTLYLAYGLCAHAASFAEAKGVRFHAVNQTAWRRHFIGAMKRGTRRQTLKDYSMERARQLGFSPRNDDEADAIGVLDYACDREGIMPPWRANEVLRPPLGVCA
ncbi:hypothetical protein SAMN06295955_11585 [Sphingopyxis indica]|uniref:Uncharacterized protein n=2 Tax=Sphingopyxis indica TaxID=436663 RepID=A0A239KNJ5_9SPHN|nr:hypothetical protein SAMN06295955_11585 [Sphingopyxis indica]